MLSWLFSKGFSPTNLSYPVPDRTDHFTEQRLNSLEITCAALWELLKTHNGYTDDELKAYIGQVSQNRNPTGSAGSRKISECPTCHHKVLTHNLTKCLWCGADFPQQPF